MIGDESFDDDLALDRKAWSYRDERWHSFLGEEIVIKRIKRDDDNDQRDRIYDEELHIDVILTDHTGRNIPVQEKSLRYKYANFNTFTVEYYQNRITKERGEFFHIAAQYYFHSYWNRDETDLLKGVIVSWMPFVEWINTLPIDFIDKHLRPATRSRAAFLWIYYTELPKDCIKYQWEEPDIKLPLGYSPRNEDHVLEDFSG